MTERKIPMKPNALLLHVAFLTKPEDADRITRELDENGIAFHAEKAHNDDGEPRYRFVIDIDRVDADEFEQVANIARNMSQGVFSLEDLR